jgi:hypothetical protein
MTFIEWWQKLGIFHGRDTVSGLIEPMAFAALTWEAAQPKWQPIEDAPLNKRILAAMKGDAPDICKLSLSPSGILVAQLDCGSRYNAKSIYEVYMELPKP